MYMYIGGGGEGGREGSLRWGGKRGRGSLRWREGGTEGITEVGWKERERITEVEGGREGQRGSLRWGGKEGGREEPNGICVLIHWV